MILGVPTLRSVVTALRRYHGKPSAPISRDPFHLILWEQVAYLVPDAQRRRAFSALRAAVGLTPPAILRATSAKLARITRLGGDSASPPSWSSVARMVICAPRFMFRCPKPGAPWRSFP